MEKRELIPQPFKGDVSVQVVLPPEALQLMNDLHQDRQGIAAGGLILLGCAVVLCFKQLFDKEKR
jgi:hypothetical protein